MSALSPSDLLARLDLRDCDCPHEYEIDRGNEDGDDEPVYRLLPCPHVAAAPRHDLSLEEWACLQRELCPEEYTDPPPPHAPALVLSREARIEVMAARESRGEHLYHPRDLWRQDAGDEVRVGVELLPRAMNGTDREGAVRRAA